MVKAENGFTFERSPVICTRSLNSFVLSFYLHASPQQDGENLRVTLHQVQAQLDAALGAQDSQRRVLEALNTQLAEKIQDLASIHSEINTALQS